MPAHGRRLPALSGPPALLLTCEHGGNEIPPAYRHLFSSAAARAALASHRGHDIGAADVARQMAAALTVPVLVATTSRLLIDLNRSAGHRSLFSSFSAALPPAFRRELLQTLHAAHREAVEAAVKAAIGNAGRCVHIAVHSFTPVLDGRRRNADIGLLYDPGRPVELALCRRWQQRLAADGLRVRRNYPYRGVADGLTTALRRKLDDTVYAGVELELNQALLGSAKARQRISRLATESLAAVVAPGMSGDG